MSEREQFIKDCKKYQLDESEYYKNTIKIIDENPHLKLSIHENYKTSGNVRVNCDPKTMRYK